ncbi:MAG TPA: PAS domain S-box protein [Spirochaetota bacterium]|nr:PAS domain S-box protein [Spirochaetota bacterium]HNT13139.1 PAS domain S-box protein [Spirochaetota bacterium]
MGQGELPKSILIVEVGEASASVEYAGLVSRGFAVRLTRDSEDVVSLYRDDPPDVVLMDIAPSRGAEAAALASKLFSLRPGSLVFIVPQSDQRQIEYLRDVPHCGNLVKGVDDSVLMETVLLSYGNFRIRERYGRLLELNPAVIYSAQVIPGEQGVMPATFVSGNVEACLGYAPEEVMNDTRFWFDCVHPDDRENVVAAVSLLFDKGALSHEYRFRHKDGSYRWLHDDLRLVYDRDGNPVDLIGSWFDITERRRMEDDLARSERMYRFIADNIGDLIFSIDMRTMATTYVSPSIERVLGFTVEERLKMSLKDMVTPASFQAGMENYSHQLEIVETGRAPQNRIFMMDLECYHKDGSVRVLETLFSGIRDADGRLTGVIGLSRDNTERRLYEEKIKLSEAHFRALIENSSDVVIVLDDGGRIRYVSPSVKHIMGYTVSERIGRYPFDNIHPDDHERIMVAMSRALRNGDKKLTVEYRFRHRNGSWLSLESTGSDLRDDPAVRGIVINTRDVTDRKEAERALEDRERYYRTLIENSSDVIAILDDTGRAIYASPSAESILGLSHGERIGENAFEYVHPDDRERTLHILSDALSKEEEVIRAEFRFLHKDGTWRYLDVIGNDRRKDTAISGIVVNIRDVTERRLMEDALRLSEERYRLLFENSLDGVLLTEPSGNILRANPMACRIFERSEEELRECGRSGIIDESDPRFESALAERELTGRFIGELNFLRKDGTPFPAEISSAVYTDDGGKIKSSMLIRDITARKRDDEKIRELLQDRETLLREVHHRIKNNMSTIASLFSLGINDIKDPSAAAVLQDMRGRVLAMMKLYDKLYRTDDYSGVNARGYVEELVREIRDSYFTGSTVAIESEIDDLRINPKSIYSLGILINELVSNALKYAFPDGGTGQISISIKSIDEAQCLLMVSDDGIGYTVDQASRLKGFGLTLVDIMVKQCDGSIKVFGENGTRYEIILKL